jgi:hypothetical protein
MVKQRVHDLGGTSGHGRIVVERGEPVYHAPWEGRVHGMMRRLLERGVFNLDQFRNAVEHMPRYLASSYYERWLWALDRLVREVELAAPRRPERTRAPAFSVGDRVRARDIDPPGHTRLPAYARGKRGVIEALHGFYRLPDTNADLVNVDWEPVYTVAFDAHELWGSEAEPRASVRIDLWQSYLSREDV